MALGSCIFCQICDGRKEANILFKDDDIVIFPDIKPAAKHHYLIVPINHIPDARHLTSNDAAMVQQMMDSAKMILEKQGADLNDARYGFHWPPFHSVSHIHLHAISPASEMTFIPRLIFRPDSMWFVSVEYVLQRIANL